MITRSQLEWSEGAAGPVLKALASDEAAGWRDYAACAETDPEIFFPEQGGSTREARKVCRGCFAREQCLEYALDHFQEWGIWGGLSGRERRRLKRSRAAA